MFPKHGGRLVRRGTAAILTLLALPLATLAQAPGRELTLEEALRLAQRSNPAFLQTSNDLVESEWQVREAYGALLPGARLSAGMSYQEGGEARLGNYTGGDLGLGSTPDYYYSSYDLGVSYSLSAATLYRLPQARAARAATEARIRAADFRLSAEVTRQYLAVLRAQDAVALAEQELERAEENLKLAGARVAVGAAIPLDEKQAAVERGRAEVGRLQARSTLRTEQLRLSELLGLESTEPLVLTSRFNVSALEHTRQELLESALARHPTLAALRAQENAAGKGVRMAQGSYLPSLSLQVGWSGYTRRAADGSYLVDQARGGIARQLQSCQDTNDLYGRLADPLPAEDCSSFQFTPEMERLILENNDQFPFNFTKEPLFASLTLSLPLFNGFTRERQLESARVAADDAELARRAEELRLRTAVTSAYDAVETARQTVELEETNRALAAEQLELARERYRVGAANFLELKDAETLKARADRAHLETLYGYHEALANLQAATGVEMNSTTENR